VSRALHQLHPSTKKKRRKNLTTTQSAGLTLHETFSKRFPVATVSKKFNETILFIFRISELLPSSSSPSILYYKSIMKNDEVNCLIPSASSRSMPFAPPTDSTA
jgi:hypothetical protein